MPEDDKILVSFGDIVLRESDAELLEGPHWLNDNIIAFWYEYLSNLWYKDYEPGLFIGPGVSHCLKASASQEELSVFLTPLSAKDKNIIFFVLNDNRSYGSCGGTHWSLLVYSKPEKIICHYDSSEGANMKQANILSRKLLKYLLPDEKGCFEEVECLQQENSYDCGIFVLCHTDHLMNHFLKDGNVMGCPTLSRTDTETKRERLLKLIRTLSN